MLSGNERRRRRHSEAANSHGGGAVAPSASASMRQGGTGRRSAATSSANASQLNAGARRRSRAASNFAPRGGTAAAGNAASPNTLGAYQRIQLQARGDNNPLVDATQYPSSDTVVLSNTLSSAFILPNVAESDAGSEYTALNVVQRNQSYGQLQLHRNENAYQPILARSGATTNDSVESAALQRLGLGLGFRL
jgi:hypothetical protein